jgi:hypothetical protein
MRVYSMLADKRKEAVPKVRIPEERSKGKERNKGFSVIMDGNSSGPFVTMKYYFHFALLRHSHINRNKYEESYPTLVFSNSSRYNNQYCSLSCR